MVKQPVVSREQWVEARKAHLAREKQLTRQRDELARQRRELPWVKIDADYTFDAPQGKVALADLFGPHSQLIVYHFMFGPDWAEGCPSCSFVADHLDAARVHLAARDVSLVVVSRAPLPKLRAFQRRMGWQFPWVSSHGTSFNHDFHVHFTPEERATGAVYYNYTTAPFPSDEAPGASAFYKDPRTGEIFHTYSTYARGLDPMIGAYALLDIAPRGRDEDHLPFEMQWVRHHDRYDDLDGRAFADADKPYWPKLETPDETPDRTPVATATATMPTGAAATSCCGSGKNP